MKVFVFGLVQAGERALSHERDPVRPSPEPLVPDLGVSSSIVIIIIIITIIIVIVIVIVIINIVTMMVIMLMLKLSPTLSLIPTCLIPWKWMEV